MSNFVPPITVVMARYSLAEVLPAFDLSILFLQCFFAMLMLLGAAATPGMASHMTTNIKMEHFMYVLQVINTVTSAGGNIATRHMKKFHESVITWYANWSILLTSLLMIAISGKGLAIFYTFSEMSWLLLIVNGVTATTFQMARTKAYQLQKAAKLQLLTPTTTCMQFLADCMIFGVVYTNTQYFAFFALIFLNFAQAIEYFWELRSNAVLPETTGEAPNFDDNPDEEEKSNRELLDQQVAESDSSSTGTNLTYQTLVDGDILSNYKECSVKSGLKKARSIMKMPLDLQS